MEYLQMFVSGIVEHWPIWFVSVVLVVAAVIDGIQLKVPNWLTFPFIISGWVYSAVAYGLAGEAWHIGLAWSLAGTVVGLALLLPLYSIGGMGAGDVKLLAGVGAWVYCSTTLYSFCFSAVVGALMAIAMVLYRKAWRKHSLQFQAIVNEIMTIKNPEVLASIAAERKSSMLLLPYGIPICIGTIIYFAWMGLLL